MNTIYHSFSLCLLNIDTYVSFIPLIPVGALRRVRRELFTMVYPKVDPGTKKKNF